MWGDLIKAFYRMLFNWLERRNRHAFKVLNIAARTFSACTPAFAAPYQIAESSRLFTPLSYAIFGAAFFHCFFLTAVLALLSGTLWSAPGSSMEFAEDVANIILYAGICPAYVTLCIRLVLLTMERDPVEMQPLTRTTAGQTRRVFICLFCVYILSSILITNYVNDALDPAVVKQAYWFVDATTGVRRLNAAALYYIVLNFALLFLTFLGGAAFIGISIDGIRLSRELLDSGIPIELESYKLRIKRLLVAYFFGTLLVCCYALNILIWKRSPLGATQNLGIAGIALTLIGIFFVAVPKQYIDHVWARYVKRREPDLERSGTEASSIDLPFRGWTLAITIINTAVLGSWFAAYFGAKEIMDILFP